MRQSTLIRFNSKEGAAKYVTKFESHLTERMRNHSEQALIESIVSHLSLGNITSSLALDMPCGIGRFYPVLQEHSKHVLQADWSMSMLQTARAGHASTALGFVRLLATELPFADGQFDLILSARLCHHIPTAEERRKYIAELFRVSRKWVVISYLDTFSPHNIYRSTSRWLSGKTPKWHISQDEVIEIAIQEGYVPVYSTLLSSLFSGQRYSVMMRLPDAAAEPDAHKPSVDAIPVRNQPKVSPAESPPPPKLRTRRGKESFCNISPWYVFFMAIALAFCLFTNVGVVEQDNIVLPLGAGLFLTGVLLRYWARLHLLSRLQKGAVFIQTGPYAWVRNPLYLGNIAIIGGFAIMTEAVFFAPIVIAIAFTMYALVVRNEEKRLMRSCGASFRDYCLAVPRWIPRLPRVKKLLDGDRCYFLALRGETRVFLFLFPILLEQLFESFYV